MSKENKINYLEVPVSDIQASKTFFSQVFTWSFEDYGPKYTVFHGAGIDGGFYQSDLKVSTDRGTVLIVLYSENLEATQAKIEAAGGEICKEIFEFPGGRRFHFTDPSGNEFAVWANQ